MSDNKQSKFSKNKFILDSSVIISGQIIDMLADGSIYERNGLDFNAEIKVILSQISIAEIENQANQDKIKGHIGIKMLKKLYKKIKNEFRESGKKITIETYGERPSLEQVKLNSGGELDALIRQHAIETGSTLITSDKIQADFAEIESIPVIFVKLENVNKIQGKRIQEYFDENSMSVHLKTGTYPQAKKGKPGDWKLSSIGEKKLLREDLVQLESSILLEVENDPESFIEKEMHGVTVVQLKNYRIVMCRPPFSNTHEITAVKPLVKLNISNYKTTPHIIRRLDKAEGILVAGSPGAGKSTFISALAEFYLKKGKVIKTLESVRDLQVPPEISQYTELENDFEKTADILLLVRPDYTIFDEIRTSSDFKIFTDMRLAGVGMIGVIHASSALDAIQRFIRRIELGVIPSVLDTVILIKKGDIAEILKIEITVKIPSGFRDQGLARPVINISDYNTDKLLYEIYEFGSNVVVIPVKSKSSYYNQYSNENNRYQTRTNYSSGKKKKKRKKGSSPGLTRGNGLIHSVAEDEYDDTLEDVETLYDIDSESDYNPDYNNDPFEPDPGSTIDFKLIYGKKSLVLRANLKFIGKYVDVYSGKDFISSVTVNQKGEIRINKNTHLFHKLDNGIREGKKIYGKKTK